MTATSVCIVGAGLAGLSLAVALGDRGSKVHIVDFDSTPSGSGIDILSSALKALDRFRIGQSIIANGTSREHMLVSDADGNITQRAGRAPETPKGDYPISVCISRLKLSQILRDEAERRGVKVVEGVTVSSIDQDEDRVHATFSDGTTQDFDLLVGSDGIRSGIRKLVFGEELAPRFSGIGLWRWLLPNPGITAAGRAYMFDDGSTLGVNPLPEDEVYVYLSVLLSENIRIDWETSRAMVDGIFAKIQDPKISQIHATLRERDSYIYRPLEVFFMESSWYRNRVVLIGDAAHAMTPHMGAGGVMAIEDALVLDEVLARNDSLSAALKEFMLRRYDRVKYIYDTSLALAALKRDTASPDFHRFSQLRNEALRLLETADP